MKWSSNHDVALAREILLFTPWIHRKGSTERGQVWENIAKSLNALETPKFRVSQRSVRDRYQLLEKKHKRKLSDEEKATGISPEDSEIDEAMEDIIAQFEEADLLNEQLTTEKKQKEEAEVEKTVEMRRCSMETFKETKKRNGDAENNEPSTKKKKRTSGSDIMRYLREKGEIDIKDIKLIFNCIAIRLCRTAHAIFFPKFWNDKMNFTRVFVTVSPRRPWDRGWYQCYIHTSRCWGSLESSTFLILSSISMKSSCIEM